MHGFLILFATTLRLSLDIQGEGTPAVILESGFRGTHQSWAKVQPEVAKFARVVSYDRAGLGASDAGPSPRTAKQIAQELHDALKAAQVKPPYVLVGHSAGGAYLRVFAHLYPTEIAGLVLADPPQEELLEWLGTHAPDADRMPEEQLAKMPAGARAEWEARSMVIAEMKDAWPLPRVPVILLTSARNDESLAKGVSPEALEVLIHARETWLKRIPGAKHIVTQKSGHNIPFDEPELIVDAIRQLITTRD